MQKASLLALCRVQPRFGYANVFGNSGGKLVQTSAEDKFIYTMPSAAELARSECLSVVFIYKLAILVIRNPRYTRPIATSIAD